MTVASFAQTPPYLVEGIGPYEISCPYTEGAIIASVLIDGRPVALDPDQVTIEPIASDAMGSLYLSADLATEHAGRTIWIDRVTEPVQGWEARYGDREVGMERQLDRDTMAIQELRAELGATLRGRAAAEPYSPTPGRVPIFRADGTGWEDGPDSDAIYQAADNAEQALQARIAAEAAAEAAQAASDGITKLAPNVSRFTADGLSRQFIVPGIFESTKYLLLWIGGEAQPRDRFTVAPDYSGNQTLITWLGRPWAAGEMIPKGWLVEWQAQYQVAVQIGEQQWSFAARSGFRTAVEGGFEVAEGTVVFAGGVSYCAQADSTAIPDLPGWVAVTPQPEQFPTYSDYMTALGLGNENVSFQTSAPDIARPVIRRARDSVSALDLMSAGGLDEAVRNREATTADAGVITAAMQEALTACAAKQWRLDIPAGLYRLESRLIAARPVTVCGAGRDRTVLDWGSASASAGIRVSSGGGFEHTAIGDLSMLTNDATPVHTAIELDYSALAGGGIITPRAQTHGSVKNVRIGSSSGSVGIGWNRGVDGISMLGLDVTDCRINGVIAGNVYGNLPASDAGIMLRGAGSPVQLTVNRTYVSGMYDAVRTEDVEGVYLSNFEFVGVGWGYRTNNTSLESGFAIENGHINSLIGGISLQRMADGIISGNTFYHVEAGAPTEIVHIRLDESAHDITISNNLFRRLTSEKTVVSIDVVGGARANIRENHHQFGSGSQDNLAVRLGASASGPIVARQSFNVVASGRQIENNCATAQFEVLRGYSGNIGSINTDWRMPVQTHQLVIGASDGPAGVNLNGVILETLSHDTNTAVQRLTHPTLDRVYMRRKSSGVWSAWRFTEFSGVPA